MPSRSPLVEPERILPDHVVDAKSALRPEALKPTLTNCPAEARITSSNILRNGNRASGSLSRSIGGSPSADHHSRCSKGLHRRCCDACSKRYLGKGPLADQVARHERKIIPGVIPFGGTLLQGCCHLGAAFGPKSAPCGKQLDRDSLDPSFARPQWLQKLFYSLAGFEPRGEGLELLLPAD